MSCARTWLGLWCWGFLLCFNGVLKEVRMRRKDNTPHGPLSTVKVCSSFGDVLLVVDRKLSVVGNAAHGNRGYWMKDSAGWGSRCVVWGCRCCCCTCVGVIAIGVVATAWVHFDWGSHHFLLLLFSFFFSSSLLLFFLFPSHDRSVSQSR